MKRKHDAVLVVSPTTYLRPDYVLLSNPEEPLGILSVLAYANANGFNCKCHYSELQDRNLDETMFRLSLENTRMIAFDSSDASFDNTVHIASFLKRRRPDVALAVGGHYATLNVETIKGSGLFDYVVVGDGEHALTAILARTDLHTHQCVEVHMAVNDIDTLPPPDRTLVQLLTQKNGYASVYTSRGCAWNCSFCSIRSYITATNVARVRLRAVQDVVMELTSLYFDHGVKKFKIVDDNFVTPEGIARIQTLRSLLFAAGVKAEFMAYARVDSLDDDVADELRRFGVTSLMLGVEAAQNSVLRDVFNKGTTVSQIKGALNTCKAFDIRPIIGLIMFHPYSSIPSLQSNVEFLRDMDLKGVTLIKHLIVHKGAGIEKRLAVDSRLMQQDGKLGYVFPDMPGRVYKVMSVLYEVVVRSKQRETQHQRWNLGGRKSMDNLSHNLFVLGHWDRLIYLFECCLCHLGEDGGGFTRIEEAISQLVDADYEGISRGDLTGSLTRFAKHSLSHASHVRVLGAEVHIDGLVFSKAGHCSRNWVTEKVFMNRVRDR